MSIGQLRDLLMSVQPLLLRVNPGTVNEMVGFRHRSIAEHVLTRELLHLTVDELWMFVDSEINAVRRAEIQEHLDECSQCLEMVADLEKLKSIVARSAGGDRAPDGLRDRIVTSVHRRTSSQQAIDISPIQPISDPHPSARNLEE